jgi:hypothetical protein
MSMYRSAGFMVTALLLSTAIAGAQVSPGDKINETSIDKVKNLISPGVEWCIRHGQPITIGETKRIEWPKAYKEATEKYAGQVKLSADGLQVQHYVAGQPFPNLDQKDPQFVLKLMWNFDYGWVKGSDDSDVRNFDADTGTVPAKGPMSVERHFLLDHFRRLFWTGRLYVEPKPEKPNPNGYRAQQGLYPILEPFDLKGVGALGNRYNDSGKQDDSWLYLPSLRRVRRLSTAQRSDALFGQDTDVDSYGGYAGQIPWFTWKFLGEKKILATFHADKFPVEYCPNGGDFVYCDNWEPRDVWVLEGVAKQPQYAYGKRVLYIDKESYFIAYSDIYDKAGQLWKIWLNQFGFRNKAAPGYGETYDSEMPFTHSISMVDMQLTHATRAALPSPKYPGEPGWYYNQGAKTGLTEEFFTIAHMIEASH